MCFLGALGLNALHGREYDGLSGPTAAQLTVLAGLHDRVGFTVKRLRETADPPTGKAACDKLFESLAAVSAGSVVLDHNACDFIKPRATVNVVSHLDPEARAVVESSNGPIVQANEGLRRFAQILKVRPYFLFATCAEAAGVRTGQTEARHRWWWNCFCGREETRATT